MVTLRVGSLASAQVYRPGRWRRDGFLCLWRSGAFALVLLDRRFFLTDRCRGTGNCPHGGWSVSSAYESKTICRERKNHRLSPMFSSEYRGTVLRASWMYVPDRHTFLSSSALFPRRHCHGKSSLFCLQQGRSVSAERVLLKTRSVITFN